MLTPLNTWRKVLALLDLLLPSYYLPPTAYHLPPTTYRLPPTTYHLPPTTYRLLRMSTRCSRCSTMRRPRRATALEHGPPTPLTRTEPNLALTPSPTLTP